MSLPKNPRILVVGTGAIGGFYGGKLHQAGAHVSTICRSDYNVVVRQGIHIKSPWGDFSFLPDRVMKNTEDYQGSPDYLLIALKSLPNIDLCSIIEQRIGEHTAIVLLQNGIGMEKVIQEKFPDHQIISALAFICVSRTSPGFIKHLDFGRLVIGNIANKNNPDIFLLEKLFRRAKVPCHLSDTILLERWKKILWNAAFNSLSVLAGGVSTTTIMKEESLKHLARQIMLEIQDIADAQGYTIPLEVIDKHLEDTTVMKPYKTSMLLDYEQKKPMEVEAILGNPLRIAKKNNIETPYIECVYTLLKWLDCKHPPVGSIFRSNAS